MTPGLEHAMTYRCMTRGPVEIPARDGSGSRQIWEVSEATLEGDRIQAELAAPGNRLDARLFGRLLAT
jgi:hypothetical protein